MTKCEAYENLKDYLDNVFHNSNDYETYCYLRDCADTLAPPDPDPITGLIRCGCGGKAKIWPSDLRQAMATAYQVGCTECAMTTGWVRGKQENAMNVWNTAMGWKGELGCHKRDNTGDTHQILPHVRAEIGE